MHNLSYSNFFIANALSKHVISKTTRPITITIKVLSLKWDGAAIQQTVFAIPVMVNRTINPILYPSDMFELEKKYIRTVEMSILKSTIK